MACVFGSLYISVCIATTIVRLIAKILAVNMRGIHTGLFRQHISYYVILQMAVQAMEDTIKVSLLLEMFVTIVALVSVTFVSVRLGHVLPLYLLVSLISGGIFVFMLAKTVLSRSGEAFKNAKKLLRSFKGVGILLGMRPGVKQGYLKDVGRLSVFKIPTGVGGTVFTTVNEYLNVRLSSMFIELSVNALILF